MNLHGFGIWPSSTLVREDQAPIGLPRGVHLVEVYVFADSYAIGP